MKSFVLFAVLSLASFVTAELYTDRYDDMNIDEVLANKRLLVAYIKCILEQGKCTPEGKELKAHIKDAMQTGCLKCTETQKKGARQVVKHLKEKEPKYYKQIVAKFDPEDKYKDIYETFLASNN